MSKVLVIAEKPSVGRDIARVLSARRNWTEPWRAENILLPWGLGSNLVSPAVIRRHYDKKYKEWKMGISLCFRRYDIDVIRQTSKAVPGGKKRRFTGRM